MWVSSPQIFGFAKFEKPGEPLEVFIEGDGLKIVWEDKWVHIRKSNTEPIIRIISEANNHEIARDLIDSLKYIINNF